MPHPSIHTWTLVTGMGIVPSSILIITTLAQATVDPGHVDWANLGAVAAIIAMMGFLLTKLLPQVNKENNETLRSITRENNETIRHVADVQKNMLEDQRKDLLQVVREARRVDPPNNHPLPIED